MSCSQGLGITRMRTLGFYTCIHYIMVWAKNSLFECLDVLGSEPVPRLISPGRALTFAVSAGPPSDSGLIRIPNKRPIPGEHRIYSGQASSPEVAAIALLSYERRLRAVHQQLLRCPTASAKLCTPQNQHGSSCSALRSWRSRVVIPGL